MIYRCTREQNVLCFSLKKNGATKLSTNFRVREFACNDGTDVVFVNPALVDILQNIRTHFNASVTITSAYRTIAYNSKVAETGEDSQHCRGNAADIKVSGVSPSAVASYAKTLLGKTGGVGTYATFTHIDVRNSCGRW